jgi:peptide/nickel transport system substrate-binding protein
MFRRNTVVGLAATLALSLAAAGCGGSSGGGGAGGGSKTLTLGVIVPATTFKAADMNFANESPYGQAVYDTLLMADPNGKVGPSLATEWKYNADRTVLTMKLRGDVTFTDGTKFNADAAAQNLVRFRDGASPNKSFLANLKDAKAVDETTVELTLTQPDPGLLNYLTQNAGMMGSPKAFGAADEKTKPVGSGPYILDTGATVIGSSYTFTKNPN